MLKEMQLSKAIELLEAQAKIDPTNLANAFMTATYMTHEDAMAAATAMQPILKLILENPTFKRFISDLTEAGRHQYRHHGRSLESLNAGVFIGGFVGGIQFMLNNMKAIDPLHADPAAPTPSPQSLVN